MPDSFRLPTSSTSTQPLGIQGSAFDSAGYYDNPFPSAGLDWGVLYVDHMTEQVAALNTWLDTVRTAVTANRAVPPISIEGALGVGKTHLLRYLETNLERHGEGQVLRKPLTEHGMTRLFLSNLLVAGLPAPPVENSRPSSMPIVDATLERLRAEPKGGDYVDELSGSPLQAPLQALLSPPDAKTKEEGHVWLARWLSRAPTTQSQRARLRLKGALEAEGEAIRAISDLMRLARRFGLLKCWFVMIDQLEELWRPGVVTYGRRARFLTDLRLLVDQALEGAPIAIMIAWNTHVSFLDPDPMDQLKQEYAALARRLGQPIAIPGLEARDIAPFAEAYLREAEPRLGIKGKEPAREGFRERLLADGKTSIVKALETSKRGTLGPGRFSAAAVLAEWRARADAVVAG